MVEHGCLEVTFLFIFYFSFLLIWGFELGNLALKFFYALQKLYLIFFYSDSSDDWKISDDSLKYPLKCPLVPGLSDFLHLYSF